MIGDICYFRRNYVSPIVKISKSNSWTWKSNSWISKSNSWIWKSNSWISKSNSWTWKSNSWTSKSNSWTSKSNSWTSKSNYWSSKRRIFSNRDFAVVTRSFSSPKTREASGTLTERISRRNKGGKGPVLVVLKMASCVKNVVKDNSHSPPCLSVKHWPCSH